MSHRILWIFLVCWMFMPMLVFGERIMENDIFEKFSLKTVSIAGGRIPIDQVLRTIARKTGVTVLVDESVSGFIPLDLKDVNLLALFRLILNSNGLHFYETKGAVIVGKPRAINAAKKGVIAVKMCPVYGKSRNLSNKMSALLSKQGSISSDPDGVCLIVRDTIPHVIRIDNLFHRLDKPVAKFDIQTLVADVDSNVINNLDIKWDFPSSNGRSELPPTANGLNPVDLQESLVFGKVSERGLDVEKFLVNQEGKEQVRLLENTVQTVEDDMTGVSILNMAAFRDGSNGRNVSGPACGQFFELGVRPRNWRDGYLRLNVRLTCRHPQDESNDDMPNLIDSAISQSFSLEDGSTAVISGILPFNSASPKTDNNLLSDLLHLNVAADSEKLSTADAEKDSSRVFMVFLSPALKKPEYEIEFSPTDTGRGPAATVQPSGSLWHKAIQATSDSQAKIFVHPLEIRSRYSSVSS